MEGVKQAKKEQLEQQKWTKPFHSYQKKTKQNIIRHLSWGVMAACADPELFIEGGMSFSDSRSQHVKKKVTRELSWKIKVSLTEGKYENFC